MGNEVNFKQEELNIDSFELLIRFILECKNKAEKDDSAYPLFDNANLVTAVYYFRRYADVNKFLEQFVKNNNDYFQIQWIRSAWTRFSNMSQEELSNLVINQISSIDKVCEE